MSTFFLNDLSVANDPGVSTESVSEGESQTKQCWGVAYKRRSSVLT